MTNQLRFPSFPQEMRDNCRETFTHRRFSGLRSNINMYMYSLMVLYFDLQNVASTENGVDGRSAKKLDKPNIADEN